MDEPEDFGNLPVGTVIRCLGQEFKVYEQKVGNWSENLHGGFGSGHFPPPVKPGDTFWTILIWTSSVRPPSYHDEYAFSCKNRSELKVHSEALRKVNEKARKNGFDSDQAMTKLREQKAVRAHSRHTVMIEACHDFIDAVLEVQKIGMPHGNEFEDSHFKECLEFTKKFLAEHRKMET